MELNELVRKRFCDSEGLQKQLATFAGQPAVFSPSPPDDKMSGWKENVHYPRIVFNYDMQASEERNSAGTLSVVLVCQNTADVVPELIEPEIRKCLKDVLLNTSGGPLYAFAWSRTEAFELQKGSGVGQQGSNEILIGSEIRFDILEYAGQETLDPDPVMAVSDFVKKMYPDCVVVGIDRMKEVTEASKDRPVVYCRLEGVTKAEETNSVVWMDGRVAIHFLCPDSEKRMKMAAAVANRMSLSGEIIMLDHSPMRITRLQASYRSDYLKDGQVFVTGRFGLLRFRAEGHRVVGIKNSLFT